MEPSLFSIAVPLLLFCGIWAAVSFLKNAFAKSRKFPPGPRGLPALHAVLKAMKTGTLHDQAKLWSAQYGELVLCRTLIGDICFLNSARMVKTMFASKELEKLTNDRPKVFFGWFSMFNYRGVLTASPSQEWIKLRKLLHSNLKYFSGSEGGFACEMETELRGVVREIEDSAHEELDTTQLFSHPMMRAMAGPRFEPGPLLIRAGQELNDLVAQMVEPSTEAALSTFPFLRLIPGTYYAQLCTRHATSKSVLLNELFDKMKASRVPNKPRGFLDAFLDEQSKDKNEWLCDDHIRAVILDIVTGAYLAPLQALRTLCFFLAHHPEVMKKMQREIDENIGERLPESNDRTFLHYSEAAIMETLRLTTTLSFPHQTNDDVTIDGFVVPRGCTLFSNAWVIHHDPDVWGDPDVFRPERFIDDTGHLVAANHPLRQKFLPFGTGRRMCPGDGFTRMRLFLYTTTLLQNFDILPPVQHDFLPLTNDSWEDKLVYELKPHHLIFRKRK
ncbi:hypothetical protein BaRGS_00010779 [Batillaria attramentaria]|uniref:Cytochrome P450 n=1 Tax=Batillaria attramentaria TaxID=370345 RepID=A0ABD0LF77_9CAEN